MNNILIFSPLNLNIGGGVNVYCESLVQLFNQNHLFNLNVASIYPHNEHFFGLRYNKSELKQFLINSDASILHLNGYTSQMLSQIVPIAKRTNRKIVYTPHWHPFWTMSKSILKKLYFSFYVAPYLKDVDMIVCINKEEVNFFSKYTDKIRLIPHWSRLNEYEGNPTPKKNNMILYVGSLTHPNKGFKNLYKIPVGKYEIHCVGKGDVQLREDMVQHKKISDSELTQLYRQSSLVVVPSKYEAFSYVSLEAMCNGTPIVISDRVRFGDFISGHKACRVYNYDDNSDFIHAIESTIGTNFDPTPIRDLFSPSKALNKYTDMYNSLL